MKLRDFLNAKQISDAEFAKTIRVSPTAVYRYAENQRTPRNGIMQRIIEATNGQVTANDFYHNH
jgi:transcriptional regulator with XRE-family HTH domain